MWWKAFVWGAIVMILGAGIRVGRGQGTVVFHNTGAGQVLVTETRSIFVDAGLQQPRLIFDFGFATDETPAPGAFLDSFTVTVQDSAQQFSAVYLTADATGVLWAPQTPGALQIDPASITANPLSYPSLQPVLANRTAFQVTAPIPSQFLGTTVNVFFDLFDNLDPTISQGWFSNLSASSVPEPQVWVLSLAGAALLLRSKRRKRQTPPL
jgi:hypothetical protein